MNLGTHASPATASRAQARIPATDMSGPAPTPADVRGGCGPAAAASGPTRGTPLRALTRRVIGGGSVLQVDHRGTTRRAPLQLGLDLSDARRGTRQGPGRPDDAGRGGPAPPQARMRVAFPSRERARSGAEQGWKGDAGMQQTSIIWDSSSDHPPPSHHLLPTSHAPPSPQRHVPAPRVPTSPGSLLLLHESSQASPGAFDEWQRDGPLRREGLDAHHRGRACSRRRDCGDWVRGEGVGVGCGRRLASVAS